jgi:pimeloyl-ACP methyl ester carboxylesterase
MPAVYPAWGRGGIDPRENISIFRSSSDPRSDVSRTAFENYTCLMTGAGVQPGDNIVWVGHSAGGQMGLTMSHLADRNNQFPISTVITMGSPIATNHAPSGVRVLNFTSPEDRIQHGAIGRQVGQPFAPNRDNNDRAVLFHRVGHTDWYRDSDPAVLDQVVALSTPPAPARVERPFLGPQFLPNLVALGQNTLDSHFNVRIPGNRGIETPNNGANVNVPPLSFRGREIIPGRTFDPTRLLPR